MKAVLVVLPVLRATEDSTDSHVTMQRQQLVVQAARGQHSDAASATASPAPASIESGYLPSGSDAFHTT